jgi:FkbM family methyltransferase
MTHVAELEHCGEIAAPPEDVNDLRLRLRYLRSHPAFRSAPLRTAFRLLCWRLRCWLKRSVIIELPQWGARFFLPARWGGEGTTMIFALREEYEAELACLDRFVTPGSVVVDAGASCGIYTVAAARLVGPTGRVVSFEPGARAADVLDRNIELNDLGNVRLHRTALSDRVGRVRLLANRGPVAQSISFETDAIDGFDEVPTTTLDETLAHEGIDRVDFIKMDIEGAEELALRGAETLLARSRPTIVLELNPAAAARLGLPTDGAWRLLESLGYSFFMLDEEGMLRPIDSPPAEDGWEFCNTIAIHRANDERTTHASRGTNR